MADDVNQEILRELKKINEKLERLEEPQGLSTPMKLLALFFGVIVLGPVFSYLLFFLIY